MGDRLKDSPKENKGIFDAAGKYCYLVICEGVDYPLNLPPQLMQEEVDDGFKLSQSEWEYAKMLVSKLEKLKGFVATADEIRSGAPAVALSPAGYWPDRA